MSEFHILIVCILVVLIGAELFLHGKSYKKIKSLREGQQQWKGIAEDKSRTIEWLRITQDTNRINFDSIKIAIWGSPPLRGRETRDIIKWIDDIKVRYVACKRANELLTHTVYSYNRQINEKNRSIGGMQVEIDALKQHVTGEQP